MVCFCIIDTIGGIYMRIWSIHPSYLDSKGIVALWREALLAQNVLLGKTKGYKSHPQLQRFKKAEDPLAAIASYLWQIHKESIVRGYVFDANKINQSENNSKIAVTNGQIQFEFDHLLNKLQTRDEKRFIKLKHLTQIAPHPLFKIIEGEIADWERI